MQVTTASDGLKKVMRIALVGINPGDQVMLKGYLRILLRLEADLEWVSATSQQIDLFMINHDFRDANNVQKLIRNQPHTATLYTTRSDTEHGYVSHDLLVLPLKDLEPLNSWLFSQVPFLSGLSAMRSTSPAIADTTAANIADAAYPAAITNHPLADHRHRQTTSESTLQPSHQTSQHDQLASDQASGLQQSIQPPSETTPSRSTPATMANPTTDPLATVSPHDLLDFANMFSRFQQRQDEVLAITNPNGTVLAYLNPKQQRVWNISAYASFNQPWLVSVADDEVKNQLDVYAASDMVQWLWALSTKQSQKLEAILDLQINYHIESWVKPLHNADQHDHLKIQSVLEARSVTLDELVAVSQCTLPQVKNTLLGLFVTGAFSASVYQRTINKLSHQINHQVEIASPTIAQIQSSTINTHATTAPSFDLDNPIASVSSPAQSTLLAASHDTQPTPIPSQSTLDDILSRRSALATSVTNDVSPDMPTSDSTTWPSNQPQSKHASGQIASESSTSISPPTTAQRSPAPSAADNQGMKGFLSRLRRRLGL